MRFLQREEPPSGHRLGTLTVEPDNLPTRVSLLTYGAGGARERALARAAELAPLLKEPGVHWVHVQGLGDRGLLRDIAAVFSLNDLAVEDIIDSHQRPKVEWIGDRALAVLRAALITSLRTVELDQVGLVVGGNYVFSVQESHSDLLEPVWGRIVRGYSDAREKNAASLAHAIVDRIVDSFYPALEEVGDRLEELEERVMEPSEEGILGEVNQVRSELVRLRRVLWPQREAVQRLARNEAKVFPAEVEAPLRDCYDHCLQVSEIVESYRELLGAINGTYLSAVSNRTNEVMRVLTIMASVFIPLTFIVGIYGMNFQNMPELNYRYGYFIVWFVMGLVAAFMVLFFHRKGWIRLWGRSASEGRSQHSDNP